MGAHRFCPSFRPILLKVARDSLGPLLETRCKFRSSAAREQKEGILSVDKISSFLVEQKRAYTNKSQANHMGSSGSLLPLLRKNDIRPSSRPQAATASGMTKHSGHVPKAQKERGRVQQRFGSSFVMTNVTKLITVKESDAIGITPLKIAVIDPYGYRYHQEALPLLIPFDWVTNTIPNAMIKSK